VLLDWEAAYTKAFQIQTSPDARTWTTIYSTTAWDPTVLAALVTHCINGGLQCDTHGFDQYKPDRGAVLGQGYQLLPGSG